MDDAVTVSRRDVDAVVMDLDGVVTDTASLHAQAWKRLFDDYLAGLPAREGEDHRPFDDDDYRRAVDGRARVDGVVGFLTSRGITASPETVQALAERKDADFTAVLQQQGALVLPGAVPLLTTLRRAGFRTAVVSASRNCRTVLGRAGITHLFEEVVDGVAAAELGLAGKPEPDTYLEAVRRLGVPVDRAVVVEDALAGVEAGRRAGFALVIGVDRRGQAQDLLAHGADVVVRDLTDVTVSLESSVGGARP